MTDCELFINLELLSFDFFFSRVWLSPLLKRLDVHGLGRSLELDPLDCAVPGLGASWLCFEKPVDCDAVLEDLCSLIESVVELLRWTCGYLYILLAASVTPSIILADQRSSNYLGVFRTKQIILIFNLSIKDFFNKIYSVYFRETDFDQFLDILDCSWKVR